ncbi:MAG: hypothetical protein J1F22_04135 [Lachnospiraceae bacterium]|nr:hypothetical protein [Lachnospiraceae bacterium]
MLGSILENLRNIVKSRLFSVVITYIALFSILISRMFYLQIIKGETYDKEASLQKQKIKTIKSARGKIYDSTGKLLATNEQSYAITIEDSGELTDNLSKNKVIMKCIRLIEKNGDTLDLEFPISITKKGKFQFNSNKSAQLRFKRDIFYCKSVDELTQEQQDMTASDCFWYLRNTSKANTTHFFDVKEEGKTDEKGRYSEKFSNKDALKIMTVRYAMLMNTYSKYEAISISTNVSERTVAAIKESSADLPGVEVSTETNRVYYDSKYFSHIIGYTGLISSDTLAQMQEENSNTEYTAADQIGKTGIEKEYEDELKGQKGSETLVIDSSSRIISSTKTKDAIAGNDIYLSINSGLQKATYKLVEKEIAGILTSKLVNSKSHGTKGKKAAGILVSIYDVYDAILQNSIVDIQHFNESDASTLEKSIYRKFSSSKKSAIRNIKRHLTYNNKTSGKQLSDALDNYMDYFFSMLRDNGILDSANMDTTNSTYNKYANDEISLSEFLIYAIKNNWINLKNLDIGDEYYSSEEVFKKIGNYIYDEITDDTAFDKKVYHTMVDTGVISGREICMLLYDQKVLKKNKTTYDKLRTGMIAPYSFLKSKIKSLEISPGDLGLTPCACSVVVTSVKTGKVLSMVSYPSYDNNKFANAVDSDYYAKVSTSSASALLNRATQQKTAPGSTFKMVTATAVLEEGIINPYSTVHDGVQFEKINKPWPKCWSTVSHGTLNVSSAIQHSCNYFFYEMGYRLGNGRENIVDNEKGLTRLKKYADKYGLTKKSGVELSEAEPTFSDVDIVRSAIGQGSNSYTPIQLSRYVTTIANGGSCYDLTLVDKIKNTKSGKTKKNSAEVNSELDFSSSTLTAIKTGMSRVVNNGSITTLFKKVPVQVAGKTGTAQITANEPNHALFVSFAPYANPEISVVVVIPNGFVSSNAAELASNIYKYYYDKESRKSLLNGKATNPTMNNDSVTD